MMICCARYIDGVVEKNCYRKKYIGAFEVFFFSLLFTCYNIYVTTIGEHYGKWQGDRGNYLYSFFYGRENSVGLDLIFQLAHYFSIDFIPLLYIISFVCCILYFVGFRKIKDQTISALVFFLSTDAIFLTFAQLKQCFSNAFGGIFFALMLDERQSKWNDLICLVLAFSASAFHSTGLILFLFFILFKLMDLSKINVRLVFVIALFCMFFYEPVLFFVAKVTSNIPMLSSKITSYFVEKPMQGNDGSWMTFVKGFPFYIVVFYALYSRKNFLFEIKKFDKYLLISFVGAILYLFSIQSYWMFRFTSLFYLPIGVFLGLLIKRESDGFVKYLIAFLVVGGLVIVNVRNIILSYINSGGY